MSPLHALVVQAEPAVLALTTVAAAGTALLLGLAGAAFLRRRSRPYLLVAGAFAALFARSAVAVGSVAGLLSPAGHHVLEHAIDVALVALVVAAVYYARTAEPEVRAS